MDAFYIRYEFVSFVDMEATMAMQFVGKFSIQSLFLMFGNFYIKI
jgi:hypothetical protein